MRVIGLIRRGGTFAVRFRIPADLRVRLGMTEFHRSLHTRDPREAERLGRQAVAWFWRQMESMRRMESVSRSDLEQAAQSYFEQLLSGHPTLPTIPMGSLAAREERRTELRSDLLALQKLIAGEAFAPTVESAAREMLFNHRLEPGQLSDADRHAATLLAA